MTIINGNHAADPIIVASDAQARAQRLAQLSQQALEAISMLLPNGSKLGVIIKGPPHVGDTGHAFFGNMTVPEIMDTGRGIARRHGISLDEAAPKQTEDDRLTDLIEKQKEIVTAAENLAGKVRRALMFLPANPQAAITALRQALGVEPEDQA